MPLRPRIAIPLLSLAMAGLAALVVALAAPGDGSPTGTSTGTPNQSQSANAPTGASPFAGAALPDDIQAPPFTLTDQHGRAVSLTTLRGRVVVLAFVYSTCGATCTLIAQQLRGALDELAPAPGAGRSQGPNPNPGPQPAVLLISTDPAADTPASIARFLTQSVLTTRANYLTGPSAELRRVWRAYRIQQADTRTAANFAQVMLIDPHGRERVLYGVEQLTGEALAHDIRALRAG